ncbi:MAG: PQQ-binding-like beta-propeller repeat protein, partial [Polyangiaceae bacterium]
MKRIRSGVVSGLVAMTLVAAAFATRHKRTPGAPAPGWSMPPDVASTIPSSSMVPHGLGVGTPPAPDDASEPLARGVAMLHGDPRHTHRALGRAPRSAPAVHWSHDVGGPVEAQIATSSDEQTLYVASLGGSLTALARADGVERWSLSLGDRSYATPCVARDGTIYVGSDSKKLVAVSPEGKVKWTLATEGDADTGPVVASDDIVVFAAGRTVYGVTPYGHLKWRFAAKRKVFTSPAIGSGG